MASWSLDLRTGQLIWPDATCNLFGIAPAEFNGTYNQFHSFILPEDVPHYDAANASLSASEPLFEVEYRIRRATVKCAGCIRAVSCIGMKRGSQSDAPGW